MHICTRRSQRTKASSVQDALQFGPQDPQPLLQGGGPPFCRTTGQSCVLRPPPRQDWHASSSVRVRFCSAILYRNMQSKFSNFPSVCVCVCRGAVEMGEWLPVYTGQTHTHTHTRNELQSAHNSTKNAVQFLKCAPPTAHFSDYSLMGRVRKISAFSGGCWKSGEGV